jgi:hypothetical protein
MFAGQFVGEHANAKHGQQIDHEGKNCTDSHITFLTKFASFK